MDSTVNLFEFPCVFIFENTLSFAYSVRGHWSQQRGHCKPGLCPLGEQRQQDMGHQGHPDRVHQSQQVENCTSIFGHIYEFPKQAFCLLAFIFAALSFFIDCTVFLLCFQTNRQFLPTVHDWDHGPHRNVQLPSNQ